jgi:hypothetical protein
MTKRKKRIQKLFQNPKTVSFLELDRVLRDCGFNKRQPHSGSSHYIYSKEERQISVPFRKPFVKEVYIKRVCELIEEEINEERS